MRVRVRAGYSFLRVQRLVSPKGHVLKERIAESIAGPKEITVSARELLGQEHKVEVLPDAPEPDESMAVAASVGAGEALGTEVEANPFGRGNGRATGHASAEIMRALRCFYRE